MRQSHFPRLIARGRLSVIYIRAGSPPPLRLELDCARADRAAGKADIEAESSINLPENMRAWWAGAPEYHWHRLPKFRRRPSALSHMTLAPVAAFANDPPDKIPTPDCLYSKRRRGRLAVPTCDLPPFVPAWRISPVSAIQRLNSFCIYGISIIWKWAGSSTPDSCAGSGEFRASVIKAPMY